MAPLFVVWRRSEQCELAQDVREKHRENARLCTMKRDLFQRRLAIQRCGLRLKNMCKTNFMNNCFI
jgi:hypothetical protein